MFTRVKSVWETRGVPRPDTRDRLLDAAWHEATELGVDDLTLAGVAARAGVSRQAVYLHFGNRASLLVEMARRIDTTSGFRERLAEARMAPPREALRRCLEHWFDYVPVVLPVHRALEAAALSAGDGAEAYQDRMQEWREALRLNVAELHAAGLLAPHWDVEAATDWIWAAVHPTTFHHLVAERGWEPERVAATTIEVLERELIRAGSRRS